jgi:PEP-CTERM motif
MMRKLLCVCGVAALALWAAPAYAATLTPCPIITGGGAGGLGVSTVYLTNTSGGTANGCNVLITFDPGGSITTTYPNAAVSYDNGADDVLVGIVNNSGSSIPSVFLSSSVTGALAIFAFEGDGACDPTWTFAGGGNPCGSVTSGYLPEGVTVSGVPSYPDQNQGTVSFAGGIPNGGSAWFSLEGPVDVSLQVTSAVPEPASLILFGTGILAFARRRRKA